MNLLKELKSDWEESIRLANLITAANYKSIREMGSPKPRENVIDALDLKANQFRDELNKITEKWGLNQSII